MRLGQFKRRLSNRPKLWIFGLLALIDLVVILGSVVWLVHSKDRYHHNSAAVASNISNTLEVSVTATVRTTDVALQLMASEMAACELAGRACSNQSEILEKTGKRIAESQGFFYSRADGRIISAYTRQGRQDNLQVDIGDRDYYLRLKDNPGLGTVISAPHIGKVTGRWSLNVVRAVTSIDGRLLGLVIASLDLEELQKLLARAEVGPKGAISLRDEAMGVILRYPEPKGIGTNIGASNISSQLREMLARDKMANVYRAETPLDGIERTVAYRHSSQYPLYVNVGLSAEDYLQPWQQEKWLTLVLLVILILFSALIGCIIWRLYRAQLIELGQRKQAELQLRGREAFLDSLLNTIPLPIFYKDRKGAYLGFNKAYEEAFCAEKSQWLGKTAFDIAPRELAEKYHAQDEALYATKGIQQYESQVRNSRGEMRDVVFHKAAFADAQGQAAGLIGAVLDVTERKASESALKAQYEQIVQLNDSLEEKARSLEEYAVELEAAHEQLKTTEGWYRSILHSAPDGVLVINERGGIMLVNAELCRMFGYTEHELLGQSMDILVPADTRSGHPEKRAGFIVEKLRTRSVHNLPGLRACRKDGSEFAVDTTLSALPESDFSEGAICVVLRDVTERRQMEVALATREHEFRTLLENTPDTVARFGSDLGRQYVNPATIAFLGMEQNLLLGRKPSEIPGGTHGAELEVRIKEAFAKGVAIEFEQTWPGKDGQEICRLVHLTPEFNSAGEVASVLAVGRDITELNAFRQKIHQMAFYDPLTALPNRALFNDRLCQMITDASWHGQSAGVMMIDMDHFKAVNDTMGHAVGDELLREAATRLTASVRAYDTVARLGGDEFAILLPEIRAGDDLGGIANKILARFDNRFLLQDKEVFMSCSIGIAHYPNDSTDAQDLLKFADSAMYFAKRSGRNNFRFYSKDLTASARERLTVESELRRAIERNELELHFQPKVSLQDGRVVGSEALLRWHHPERGMVPPIHFIQIAEDSGLIIDIGKWVLRDACQTAAEWNAGSEAIHKIAINLSPRQFQTPDLLATVIRTLDETGCQAEWIELEITESLLLDEAGQVLEILEAFRVMGISIAIDDFGTGYSALSYLARFPIDTLKIDRSFISTVTSDYYRAELVRAILSIARCLGQQVVAEGVETIEQAAFLATHECQVAQGFLYSKAVPKREFALLPRYFCPPLEQR
jgi:diguanylate cyclase (GGDEF)-like protein/PAS domain S-box-containing protein